MSRKLKTDYSALGKLTESQLALLVASEHLEEIRFCPQWRRWLTWEKGRWREDPTAGQVQRLLIRTIRLAREKANEQNDQQAVNALFKAEDRSRRDNIVSLASHEAVLQLDHEKLDADPMLLNLPNGTLHLATGDLRPHRYQDLLTKLAGTKSEPAATCPLWEKFLARIFKGDDELISFVQRAVGYSLTGHVRERVLFILWGGGDNGKSTFLEVLLALLGDYGCAGAQDLLLMTKHESHPTGLADLRGARMVVFQETGEDQRFNEARVKWLTGGDRVKARLMRQDFWEFDPSHKFWIGTNHRPAIHGADNAIRRRILLLPFEVTIPKPQQDPQLKHKLIAELPGILLWAVEGCLAWQQKGLQPPQKVTAAVAAYRQAEDRLSAFLAERCEEGPTFEVSSGQLYGNYRNWSELNGETPMAAQAFARRLKEGRRISSEERGHKKVRTWVGLRLRQPVRVDAAGSPHFLLEKVP